MKKSEIYGFALLAVMEDKVLSNKMKLEIIRELQNEERIALMIEEKEEQERKIQ